ncbi:hypothetical protein GQ457_07G014670 [Hibiscus cannabinus]
MHAADAAVAAAAAAADAAVAAAATAVRAAASVAAAAATAVAATNPADAAAAANAAAVRAAAAAADAAATAAAAVAADVAADAAADVVPATVVTSLLGTRVEWLYHILQAFNSGDLACYQELCHVHNAAMRAQPALVENEKKLLEKVNILCLMEIIFSRSSEDRTIPLNVIAERTKLSIEDVEHLLMKSLSVHLIEGTIHVSWVQPRVLGIPQIKSLRERLDN